MSIATAQFDYLRRLVRQHTAIVIDEGKDYLAESRLAPLVEREGFASIDELIRSLEKHPIGPRHQRVMDAMTNNETWFFRDFQPFDALRKQILPEIFREAEGREVRFWSAASSSGQEAYSLAMSLREGFPRNSHQCSILATDLAEHILERAREGRYSQMEVSRGLPANLLARYFEQVEARWALKPEIRSMVQFRQMNLITHWPKMPMMDVVMLRNVLIYFDVSVKRTILGKLKSVLRRGGYMFLGAAETTLNLDDEFERIPFGRSVYYRLRN